MRGLLLSQEIQCACSLNFAREVGLAEVRILHFAIDFVRSYLFLPQLSTTILFTSNFIVIIKVLSRASGERGS